MSLDEDITERETEFELPFGRSFRLFEAGFFAVTLAVSVVFLVTSGVGFLTGEAPGLVRALLSLSFGSVVGLVSLVGGRNAWQLLRDGRPAVSVNEDGILNRTYWSATTRVPWDEVVDIRRTRFQFVSEIILTDPEAFRRRQILPIRLVMRLTSLFGIGSLPLHLPQIATSGDEVMSRLTEALEERELAAVREFRRLEAATQKDLPSRGPDVG